MAKETYEQKAEKLKRIGIEINTEFEISPQAEAIIKSMEDFNTLHFMAWWKKHYGIINGMHLHHYFSVSDGINESKGIKG